MSKGILRLFLAFCVIAGHSQMTVFGVLGPNWSVWAVQIFFVISGFYMALILNTSYRTLPVKSFYFSRAVRIYPTYSLALIFSFVSLCLQDSLSKFYSDLNVWQFLYVLFMNIFIFGQDLATFVCIDVHGACINPIEVFINPPSWTICIELLFYLIAPFFIKSMKKTFLFLSIGVIYYTLTPFLDIKFVQQLFNNPSISFDGTIRYTFFISTILFFGMGAIVYHLFSRDGTHGILVNHKHYVSFLGVVFCLAIFAEPAIAWWCLLPIAISVSSVFSASRNLKFDRLVGELSFAVYIFHYPVLRIIEKELPHGLWLFNVGTSTAIVSVIIAYIVHRVVDLPLNNWRHNKYLLNK